MVKNIETFTETLSTVCLCHVTLRGVRTYVAFVRTWRCARVPTEQTRGFGGDHDESLDKRLLESLLI